MTMTHHMKLLYTIAVPFIAFGDWGSGTLDQRAVATAAASYCQKQDCEFVVALGDNFYENGVRSVDDPKWKHYYRDVYDKLKLPFYAVIGNHDERGSVQAQIDYSKRDASWHMPGRFYSVKFPEKSTAPLVELFIINNGDDRFEPEEKAWLESALATSHARWKILALHKPIISNGRHGDNSSDINDELVPVICGKVDMVIAGHDHIFSHLRGPWKACTVDQLIMGTGGKELRTATTGDPRVISTGSFFGFGWFSASSDALTFRMIKTDGSIFYETTWKK